MMAKIIKIAKALRNHWKKSIFGIAASSYGISYAVGKYKTSLLMESYCEEAKQYGEEALPSVKKARHVTVILNPVAHDGKAKSLYERYSAPLLNLAGLKVSLIQTEKEGQARDIMEIMDNTDAVIIAGGNGTLHEAATGLFRRLGEKENTPSTVPLGVIPVGKRNIIAKCLFWTKEANEAQWIAEATMSVIKETTTLLDVIKIEGEKGKPVYALSSFEMGAFSDIEATLSKYWYFGPLKRKLGYVINSIKKWSIISDTDLEYVAACSGCSRCYIPPLPQKNNLESQRWWTAFLPRSPVTASIVPVKDCSNIINEECGLKHVKRAPFSNIFVSTKTTHANNSEQDSSLWINICPAELTKKQFINLGWFHYENPFTPNAVNNSTVCAREVKFSPKDMEGRWYYIDNENYEVQPIHISLLPRHCLVYSRA